MDVPDNDVPHDDAESVAENFAVSGNRSRSDIKIIRRAVENGWPITPAIRQLVVGMMARVVANSKFDRNKIAASRVLIAADGANMDAETLAQRERLANRPGLQEEEPFFSPEAVSDILKNKKALKALLDFNEQVANGKDPITVPTVYAQHNGNGHSAPDVAAGEAPDVPGPSSNGGVSQD